MISRKNLWKLCDKYIREVISGPLGPLDLKYKGIFHWVIEFPMQKYGPMIDPPKPISMSFAVGRFEVATRYNNPSYVYETRMRFIHNGQNYQYSFEIPGEAWSRKALEYHFKEYCRNFEKETGLVKLTPEEEYQKEHAEEKKKYFEKLYAMGAVDKTVYMAELKAEIEQLKTQPPKPVYVVKGPDGNMHVASPDESQKIMHQVMHTAQMAMEAATSEPLFNNLKAMAEKYYQDHGEYPDPKTFMGMKLAFEDLEKEVYNTPPPKQQYIYQGGQKYGKIKHVGVQGGSFKSPQSYNNAGNELAKIIPALSYRGAMCPAADQQIETSDVRCHMKGQTLSELIIHLNDSHCWPRSGTDPNPYNRPNIADWIDEVCLTHNLDQSFHPPGEKQQERMKTLEEVNKAQQESVKNNKQAIKKITYKNPKKLTKNEAAEAIEGAKLAFHIEDEPFYPKGMFDEA